MRPITLSQGATTSGCLNHLKRFHPEVLAKREVEDDEARPSKRKSIVWSFFVREEEEEVDGGVGGRLRCNQCDVTLPWSSSTSNALTHLRSVGCIGKQV